MVFFDFYELWISTTRSNKQRQNSNWLIHSFLCFHLIISAATALSLFLVPVCCVENLDHLPWALIAQLCLGCSSLFNTLYNIVNIHNIHKFNTLYNIVNIHNAVNVT